MANYPFRAIEKKWQALWQQTNAFKADANSSKPKTYVLEMLPYPSGRLHMGHVRNYTIGDVIARYKRALGYEVLHPMGWDAFGLPAENAALEHNIHPKIWVQDNINTMRQELQSLGFSYDWERELNTSDPSYYVHEQQIFLEFYRRNLLGRKELWVNWDPVENTVLANEQVVEGRGWRSGALVERRKLTQWSLGITQYAEALLNDLQNLSGWPEKIIRMQENWIGRSSGTIIDFKVPELHYTLQIFTTRVETLFGAAFCALAPDHPLAERLSHKDPGLKDFLEVCHRTSTTEASLSIAEKKGYNTGIKVTHPLLPDLSLPLYVANFVIMEYGTGAIFGCPAHDERDLEFANLYGLPIKPVIDEAETMINSQFLNGLSLAAAQEKMKELIVAKGWGRPHVTYRLRDWCISRQRYWGCPIPIIYCPQCGVVPVPDQALPVTLPEDVVFKGKHNPLEAHPTWKHVSCPRCQHPALRDTDTLDTFFESSWYFLRYCCPDSSVPLDKEAVNTWLPVNCYIGGIEHAVLHLLYARFFTKAMADCGYFNLSEPFANLLTQGMVCHQTYQRPKGRWLYPYEVLSQQDGSFVTVDGGYPVMVGRSEKMSKSKKNLIDPQEIINTYGADTARIFVLSDTPPDRDLDWSEEGLEGCWRYLNRVWRLRDQVLNYPTDLAFDEAASLQLRKLSHQAIEKITENYNSQVFNKVIALIRELTNSLERAVHKAKASYTSLVEAFELLLAMLQPIAPHITAELWQSLPQHQEPLSLQPWPQADHTLTAQAEVNIAVQVNGKLRGSFRVALHSNEATLQAQALAVPNVQKEIGTNTIKRIIIVPNKIVNVLV